MEVTAHEKLSYVFDRATLGSQVAYTNEARRIAAPKSYYASLVTHLTAVRQIRRANFRNHWPKHTTSYFSSILAWIVSFV
jgi:hypothetical protein